MASSRKKILFWGIMAAMGVCLVITGPVVAKKKKTHPFDLFPHEMHTPLFQGAGVACELCHADPDSYADRSKINPQGCHECHRNPNPPLQASTDCNRCHAEGFPKPQNHKVDWLSRHQIFAKQNPSECTQCHANQMFCVDCHQRRDTVQQRVHRRNFKLSHSIQARANPRKCDACHTVDYCQDCHSGRGTSGR